MICQKTDVFKFTTLREGVCGHEKTDIVIVSTFEREWWS